MRPTLTLLASFLLSTVVQASDRPNIVILMADDMGVGDTSAYQDWTGNAKAVQVHTPNMQRLAKMGIRFTDAHTPTSRCSGTRYGLLTGRYSWRTRLKYSVLWGPQKPPLIEPDRPTLATLVKSQGYRTCMTGKWHVGLTYRNAAGKPAAAYEESDFRQGIADGPINHGFDFFQGVSRSHPTSNLQGWLRGDQVVDATGPLTVDRSKYLLNETGTRHFQFAQKFLKEHLAGENTKTKPFFLYYACTANHTPHTPSKAINGIPVKGRSHPGGIRSDFIYENDVVLGQLLRILQQGDDPRRPGKKLIDNTLFIFTSDNGAENRAKSATGPLRSNKGSVYEGGHRVPFIAVWPAGDIGNGDQSNAGISSQFPITLVDVFATLAEVVDAKPTGKIGGEDSTSILAALKNRPPTTRTPLVHHDHKDGRKGEKAACLALRLDHPTIAGKAYPGQWKLLVDEGLLLHGKAKPLELYNLAKDRLESRNRISDSSLQPLIKAMTKQLADIHDRGRLVP